MYIQGSMGGAFLTEPVGFNGNLGLKISARACDGKGREIESWQYIASLLNIITHVQRPISQIY